MPWGHAEKEKPGRWFGNFKTRKEAIEDGRKTYQDDFWVQRGEYFDALEFIPDAEAVISGAASNAYSETELAEGWPEVSPEAEAELNALLVKWAKKHLPKPTFWRAVDEPELIPHGDRALGLIVAHVSRMTPADMHKNNLFYMEMRRRARSMGVPWKDILSAAKKVSKP